MSNLLFTLLFLLSCAKNTAPIDSAVIDTGVQQEDGITWEECSYRIGEHICNLELIDSDGKEFKLYEHHGRPIVIDLSAEWCGICKHTADQGEVFMENWKEHDLLWVNILMENDQGEEPNATDMSEWIALSNIQNSVLLYGSRDLIDPTAMNGFPVSGWPTFVIINYSLSLLKSRSSF